jgi:hypothetical protein
MDIERLHVRHSVLALATCAGLLIACNRYEWVPDYETEACRNRKAEPSVPVPPPRFIPSSAEGGRSLSGIVTMGGSNKPAHSQVTVYATPPVVVNTDSLGRFTISAPSGRYRFRVRTLAYKLVQDSVTLPPPTHSVLAITVDPQPVMLDGPCSGFAVARVRKPWWKFW